MKKINETILRKLVREVLIEADVIRRKAGSGEKTRVQDQSEFSRKQVNHLEDVQFKLSKSGKFEGSQKDLEDLTGPNSPFVDNTEAFKKTYNNGIEKSYVWIKPKRPPGEDQRGFRKEVDPPEIKNGDLVIIPELLAKGIAGPAIVVGPKRNYPLSKFGVKRKDQSSVEPGVPVVDLSFLQRNDMKLKNLPEHVALPSELKNVGIAFLVRIGSSNSPNTIEKQAEVVRAFDYALGMKHKK